MESDATRICELLVGLPDVNILGVEDEDGEPLRVHVERRLDGPVACRTCGQIAWVKDRPAVELADLPCFGRPARLVWHKHWCGTSIGGSAPTATARRGRSPGRTHESPRPGER